MAPKRPASQQASDTSDKRSKTLLSTKDSEIAQLRADFQAAMAAATAKETQIVQLRANLVRASESATARNNEFTKLIERLKSAEQALRQEVKKNEDLRRIYTVHGNTQHFSKRRVEELEVKNEELEEQKAELQEWFCRAQGELVDLRERLDRLGRLVQARGV
ncbi:hypothetical protein G6514_002086 [Epicoccum nigrum]|nr:hypothetical protein G6514_002086 [Epicoccum nigrum]